MKSYQPIFVLKELVTKLHLCFVGKLQIKKNNNETWYYAQKRDIKREIKFFLEKFE